MKKVFLTFFAAAILFSGCSDENGVNDPNVIAGKLLNVKSIAISISNIDVMKTTSTYSRNPMGEVSNNNSTGITALNENFNLEIDTNYIIKSTQRYFEYNYKYSSMSSASGSFLSIYLNNDGKTIDTLRFSEYSNSDNHISAGSGSSRDYQSGVGVFSIKPISISDTMNVYEFSSNEINTNNFLFTNERSSSSSDPWASSSSNEVINKIEKINADSKIRIIIKF